MRVSLIRGLFLLLLCLYPWLTVAEETSKAVGRVARIEPLPQRSTGNAGLFIGANEFEDESLRTLNYAVNDAVAQAHLFVIELQLVGPSNATLLLSGKPRTTDATTQLEALKKSGVRVVDARRTVLLRELARLNLLAQSPSDLVLVSISSHGFEENGIPYAMPADGLRDFLADSAINLKTVENQLSRSKAGKRLLLVDACREKVSSDGKGGDQPMGASFRDALAAAEGQAVLASCDVGQLSFEENRFGHGVFTYFLLQAIRGDAPANTKGFITLGTVSDYIAQSVNDWVRRNKAGSSMAQRPWFKGPNDARDIPLAISREAKQEVVEVEKRKARALNYLSEARRKDRQSISGQMEDAVEHAVATFAGSKLEELLEQLDLLADPKPVSVRNFVDYWQRLTAPAPSAYDENAERLAMICFTNLLPELTGSPHGELVEPAEERKKAKKVCPSGGKYSEEDDYGRRQCSIPLHRCIQTLSAINNTKMSWDIGHPDAPAQPPTLLDLLGEEYLAQHTCPSKGKYTAGRIGEPPTCSAAGHRLPGFTPDSYLQAKTAAQSRRCEGQLDAIGLFLGLKADDHGGQFLFNVSTNEGGTKELTRVGPDGFEINAVTQFRRMDVYGGTKMFVCPADSKRAAKDYSQLTPENISYRIRVAAEFKSGEIVAVCPVHTNVLFTYGDRFQSQDSSPRRIALVVANPETVAIEQETCIDNLKEIDYAKNRWALDHRKSAEVIPADVDLFGPNLYRQEKPFCGLGGIYTIGPLSDLPKCNVAGHVLTE